MPDTHRCAAITLKRMLPPVIIAVPPSASPLLEGTAGYVTEGQWVAASCNSAPALPPPALTFYINDRPVESLTYFSFYLF